MRMFERKKQKPLYWIVASIVVACIGAMIGTLSLDFNARLCVWYIILTTLAIVLGVIAIIEILKNWKAETVMAILELLGLLLAGILLIAFILGRISASRLTRSITANTLTTVRNTKSLINRYSQMRNHMPLSEHWCNSLIEYDPAINERSFGIAQLRNVVCILAFNKNLSNVTMDDLQGKDNVVLIFEADGELNLSGGPELISKERTKDKYFLFGRQKFIYVLFVDGTIAKYRLRDGSVALYDSDKDEFKDWIEAGQTPYSPLRWK